MVTAKKVIWTEAAKKDLQQIYMRKAARSADQAKAVVEAILNATEELNTKYPAGTPEPLLAAEKEPYKFIIVGFYRVIYSVVGEEVLIEVILHQRQYPVVS
ncbi:MAG: type II toxin-antitoxin system RelE/ParE family toxin [Microscillaceae bacterium]|nr:type II toxin-antitoxin system RelE/ParE family toxin [Microscillaceae bacterium]MDW8460994.1 type II toxin-antitoxin system RelE/ParE family toxin [Cytophagales bacterium]